MWLSPVASGALLLAATFGVSLAQTPSFSSPETAATVSVVSGRVEIWRDSQPWALHPGQPVRPGQEVRTGADGYILFAVADGSTFEVFPNSHVVFRDNPGNFRDLLNLMLGRVKVYIQKLNGQPNHNRVTTPTALITVRGTVFDVQVEDGESTLVAVEEGQVEVAHRLLPSSKRVYLNPGDTLRVFKNEPIAKNRIEKDSIWRAVLRAATDAIYTQVSSNPGGRGPSGGGSGGGGGGTPGDKDDNPTPPPPPPPPAP
jgi:hypothetical protein